MGSFGILHWIIVLVFLGFPLAILLFVRRMSRASGRNESVTRMESPPSRDSSESRLLRLESLLKKGLITRAEYERQRSDIIAGI